MLVRLLAITLTAVLADNGWTQEIVSLSTRPGVTQSYLLEGMAGKPQGAAVLFAGSGGLIQLRREKDEIKFESDNFLVRSRAEFINRGVSAAVVDAPSDQQSGYGMAHDFRIGQDHFKDISAVVADLHKRFFGVPLFLVGTSRGTISVASLAARFGQKISGVVMTAAMFNPTGRRSPSPSPGLSQFEFGSIKVPIIFVHHVDDRCNVTPYSGTAPFARRYSLITVHGGLPAKSNDCEGLSAHGFYGKERETIAEIVNWMVKKSFREEVR